MQQFLAEFWLITMFKQLLIAGQEVNHRFFFFFYKGALYKEITSIKLTIQPIFESISFLFQILLVSSFSRKMELHLWTIEPMIS